MRSTKEAVSILRIPEMPEIFGFLEIPAISEISDLHRMVSKSYYTLTRISKYAYA